MNTGFLGLAVATVLTACGIETPRLLIPIAVSVLLQQFLPLAVLKPINWNPYFLDTAVATVLTACGIETFHIQNLLL